MLPETVEQEFNNADIKAVNEGIYAPLHDLLNRGGKQWRPLLGLMFAEQFGRKIEDIEENKDVYFAAGMTEIVHNGSLIIDDIEDNSSMRRGDLCTYKKYGLDVAINSGNLMYMAPMSKIGDYIPAEHHSKLFQIYMNEMMSLHYGQNWDIM